MTNEHYLEVAKECKAYINLFSKYGTEITFNEKALDAYTAEAYDREHAAKVLEEAAKKFSSVEGYTKNIRVEISGWLELQAAELRAANKKEN